MASTEDLGMADHQASMDSNVTTYNHQRADSAMARRIFPEWGRRLNSDSSAESPWTRKIILSLDGGGIRGYASLLIMKELMRRVELQEPSANSSDYPWLHHPEHQSNIPKHRKGCRPHQYFDYFVGTSTGGLSAIMLGRLQMSVPKAIEQYDIVGNQVFGHPRKMTFMGLGCPRYKASRMNNAVQDAMLEGVAPELARTEDFHVDLPFVSQRQERHGLDDTAKLLVTQLKNKARGVRFRNENADAARTVVVSNGGHTQRETYLFRSFDHPAPSPAAGENRGLHLNHGPASDAAIWKAARATSAAPGYFSIMKIGDGRFEDGGMGANNPVRLAYDEVKQMHLKREPLLILSIGTGVQTADQWKPDSIFRPLKHLVRMARDFHDLKQKITDSELTHAKFQGHISDRNSELDDKEQISYFRFNVPGIADISLDEWQPPTNGSLTKTKIEEAVQTYLANATVSSNLDKCASILVSKRLARARTERWERFALHLTYCCPEERCQSVPFNSRRDLRQHAIDFHGFVWKIECTDGHHGSHSGTYSCIWDHCGEQRISIFNDRVLFEDHLKEAHGFAHPKIMESEEFEAWLDSGRLTTEEAASRQHTVVGSGKKKKKKKK